MAIHALDDVAPSLRSSHRSVEGAEMKLGQPREHLRRIHEGPAEVESVGNIVGAAEGLEMRFRIGRPARYGKAAARRTLVARHGVVDAVAVREVTDAASSSDRVHNTGTRDRIDESRFARGCGERELVRSSGN